MKWLAAYQGRVGAHPFTPSQILVLWFAALVVVGTILLALPASSVPGRDLRLINALFMATSAVCVTGLAVTSVTGDLTTTGQIVVLVLMQLGGLGYMVASTVIVIVLGRKIGLRQRLVLQEALHVITPGGLIHLLRGILWMTVLVEGLGSILLSIRFASEVPWPRAIYLGVFHAVSAFNNAGFSLFSDSLMGYRSDLVVNAVVTGLVLVGGIGYVVYQDLFRYAKREIFRLSAHSWMALTVTAVVSVVGSGMFWVLESANPATLGHLTPLEQGAVSVFHGAGARISGFNTVDIGGASTATMYFLILLMFVGASPTGTGGGIKTTTLGIMVVGVWSVMRGRQDVRAFHRRLSHDNVLRAFSVALLAFFLTTGVTLLLQVSEGREFLRTMFEVVSAFGTVGLSTGDGGVLSYSASFSDFGKLMIIVMMFIGRLGPITVGSALLTEEETRRYRVPEERILIG